VAKNIIDFLLDFFYPQRCMGCGKRENYKSGGVCLNCLKKIDYPTILKYNNIFAATDYNDPLIQKIIWSLKYHGIKQLAKPLGRLIIQRLSEKIKFDDYDIFIPIPVSKSRSRERGFNQTELIAHQIRANIGSDDNIKVLPNVLLKIKETPSQVSLKDRNKRLNNIKGSFGIKNAELIKNKNIIIIDDVSTTGATIKEAAKILKRAGAKRVIAIVVARG